MKRKVRKFVIGGVILAFIFGGCGTLGFRTPVKEASYYYVSTTGSDNNNGMSTSTAFATINKAVSMVSPGDYIEVMGGTYYQRVSIVDKSGTSNNKITLEAYNGQSVVLDDINTPVNPDNPYSRDAIIRLNSDYWVIKGFELANAPAVAIGTGGSHNEVRDIYAHDGYYGIFAAGSYNDFYDCISEYVFDYAGNPQEEGHGPGEDGNAWNCNGQYNTYTRCIARYGSDDGFDCWGGRYHTFYDCIANNNGSNEGNRNRTFDRPESSGGDGRGFKLGLGGDNGLANNTCIRCVSFYNSGCGFDTNGGDYNTMFNCTAYDNTISGFCIQDDYTVVKNCICYNPGHNLIDIYKEPTEERNSWNDPPNITLQASDFASLDYGDPDFLHLSSNSQCIDKGGVDLGFEYNGKAPDLGAYESQSVPTQTPSHAAISADNVISTLTIDGNLDESAWDLNTTASKGVIRTSNNTVTFGALWDSNYLYVGAKVIDGNLYNDSESIWDDDSLEVYIDGDHNRGTTYDSHDRQFIIGYNDDTIFSNQSATGVLHAWASVSGGYTVEIAVPWSNIGVTPAGNMTIGFDIGNNDDDNGSTRDSQLVWNGTVNDYVDTSAFGDCVLSAK